MQASVPEVPPTSEGLPDLPAVDELIAAARSRLAFYEERRAEAQAQIDIALEYLDRLAGRPPTATRRARPGERPVKAVSQDTLRAVLAKVAAHGQGCYVSTLCNETGKGTSTVSNALAHAIVDDLVRYESRKNGRRRYWITTAGEDFLTAPTPSAG